MDEQITEMLKYIRFRGLLANWDRYIEMARKENFSHVRLLNYIVEEEYKMKKQNSRKMRLTRAKIPGKYVMETFPFDRQPNLNKKILSIYDSFDYMSKNQNVIWIGPTEPGKQDFQRHFLFKQFIMGIVDVSSCFPS